jgi:type I thyroxine 5'-deiodinase
VPALNALYDRYKDRVAFYVVYIQEAHPVDLWQMGINEREGVLVHSTNSPDERASAASTCAVRLGIKPPALIDRPDDAVERAYAGWPDRLYLIDAAGRIAFKSEPGPFGFEPAKLQSALQRLDPK